MAGTSDLTRCQQLLEPYYKAYDADRALREALSHSSAGGGDVSMEDLVREAKVLCAAVDDWHQYASARRMGEVWARLEEIKGLLAPVE